RILQEREDLPVPVALRAPSQDVDDAAREIDRGVLERASGLGSHAVSRCGPQADPRGEARGPRSFLDAERSREGPSLPRRRSGAADLERGNEREDDGTPGERGRPESVLDRWDCPVMVHRSAELSLLCRTAGLAASERRGAGGGLRADRRVPRRTPARPCAI